MDRAKAKTMTARVQLAAGAFVALAVVAAVAPLGISKAETPAAAPAPAPVKPPEPAAAKVEIDVPLLSTALNAISGPVKNQPVPVDEPPVTEAAPVPVDAWRYLGAIMSNTYKRAIVVFNEQQHLLAEGQRFDPNARPGVDPNPAAEIEVVEIAPTYIKIKQGETEKQIDVAPRQRAALNVLDPAVVRNANSMSRGVSSNYTPPATSGYAGANGNSDNARRMRDLERQKADAKARGDQKTAEQLDQIITDSGRYEKGEKSEKGEKGAK